MAPIEFEDNIREKLQERELRPSGDAWARLESRLGEEKKSGLSRVSWFAIAASFIGILILASVFLNSSATTNNNELVVEEIPAVKTLDIKPLKNEQEEFIPLNTIDDEVAFEENISEENKENVVAPVNQSQHEKIVPKITESIQKGTPVIAGATIEKKSNIEIDKINNSEITNDATFINSKVDEVVASVQNKEKNNENVTPEDIDAMLLKAQREISNRRILNAQSNKVDAAALLMDVEFELERSFRDRVFDALGEGYLIIRTAVTERNY